MDHFNHEVYGELLSMRELQSRLGMCLENQERIHQRLDAFCTGINELVEQVNTHSEAWVALKDVLAEHKGDIEQLKRSAEKSEVAMARAHKSLDHRLQWQAKAIGQLQTYTDIGERPAKGNLADRVEELENDKEIERRANNV